MRHFFHHHQILSRLQFIGLAILVLVSTHLSIMMVSEEAQAEIPPKIKVVGTLAMYGTVGGALLGAATMAYGTSSRAIFQGASLGLYAGILFGGYILLSHRYRSQSDPSSYTYPNDGGNPYQGEMNNSGYSSEYRWRWDNIQESAGLGIKVRPVWGQSREKGQSIPFYLHLFQFQF